MLKLYNTLTRKKEVFKPIKDKKVGMYSCGPTVYWYQHIGNMRSYVFADILKRVLQYNGYKVKHVINVTDVGHLTSDDDTGEDKMEKAVKREKKTAKEIADFYFKKFKEDLKKLNFTEPDKWPKATEHIKDMIDMVQTLIDKGFTYETSDGIYFDTSKLKDYGKLANLNLKKLKAGKRIDMKEKRNKTDFALWKFSEEKGKRQQEWEAFGRTGFPGWHIECSVMSSKYLGEQFDIHTGGEDHISVHHTNEIAQSETAFGKKPWVKYWLHCSWLLFNKGKMSKSKGDILTLEKLEEEGFKPLDYRYFLLNAHYRKQLDFSTEALRNAKNSYERLKNIIAEIKDDKKINEKYLKRFEEAINDDLNTPNALSVLWELVRDKKSEGKIKTIEKMDGVLGLDLLKKEKKYIPEAIEKLAEERLEARTNKDWDKADKLREEINSKGYIIEDTKKGYKIKKE
ncbi:cysteine--tRNA ligase [Candidatus Woesearchaeota archaeon]|nr:cysteine--tRNA ligase [Candidatus Woesearchaeota archaeon]